MREEGQGDGIDTVASFQQWARGRKRIGGLGGRNRVGGSRGALIPTVEAEGGGKGGREGGQVGQKKGHRPSA